MSISFAARRIVTLFLIATLLPVQGMAWPGPWSGKRAAGEPVDALAWRAFLTAMNSTDQLVVMTGPGRPQIYIVFRVDMSVPTANAALITAADQAWFNQVLAEAMKHLTPTATNEPKEDILGDIAAGDARSTQSATTLARMPGTLEFERNPNDSVPVEQSMKLAVEDALEKAGFSNPNNLGTSDFTRGTGVVTYEAQLADGDVKVTGTLVNGQIVLTKEFKPLVGGGNLGDPIIIRNANISTPVNNAAAANSVSVAATATPLVASPSAYNTALRTELEQKAQTITPNQTSTNLMGEIKIRDTYVAQLNTTAAGFKTLLNDPAQLSTVTRDLRANAMAADNAYQNMLGAERGVAEAQSRNPRADQKGEYETSMRSAQQLEAKGDLAGAEKIRQAASNTAYGNFVVRQQQFFQVLDQNPLLGLGERNSVMPDNFLFKTLLNTLPDNAPHSQYVELVVPYLQKGLTAAEDEVTRVSKLKTAGEFVEFGAPKYERTRAAMSAEGDANGSNLPYQLGEAAEGHYEAVEGSKAVQTQITNFGLNLIAGTAWVFPFIGPFISAGAAAVQVVRDGNELVVAVLDAEDARDLANVTGYTHIITAEDRAAAARGQFAMSVAGFAMEGLQAIKVVKGPVAPKAGSAAGDAAAGARNAAGDAAPTAARNAPATSTPAKPSSPAVATATEDQVNKLANRNSPELPGVRDASGKVVQGPMTRAVTLDEKIAADAADLQELYDANLAFARKAGVPEDRIKTIIGDGDPTDQIVNDLYREAVAAEGKINIPRDEATMLSQIDIRNGSGLMSEADYDFLRNQLSKDATYIDNLPNRGRMQQGNQISNGFEPSMTPERRDLLLKNPRVAQMVADAKAAAANADSVIIPRNSAAAPQVGPEATAPTRRFGPETTAPTQRFGPGTTSPTVPVDPNKTVIDPGKTVIDPGKTVIDPGKTVIDPGKTVIDPNITVLMTNELALSLPKARQAGQTPQQAAAVIQNAMTRFGIGPQQMLPILQQQLAPRPVSFSDLGNPQTAAAYGGLNVSLSATGVSSGDAFNVSAINTGTMPIHLAGEGIVVEPVIGGPTINNAAIARTAAPMTPQISTAAVEAFCLERTRPVAPPGTQYRVAPPAMQAQHHSLVNVLHAAQRVMDIGGLHPDSEPKSYFNFIRQWSIWSRQENFDEKRFSEEFMNQTKKNVEGQGVKWTNAMQETVRKATPGRWLAIRRVLDEAMKLAPRG